MTTADGVALATLVMEHALKYPQLWDAVRKADPDYGETRSVAMSDAMTRLSGVMNDRHGSWVDFGRATTPAIQQVRDSMTAPTFVLVVYGAALAYLHPEEFVLLRDMGSDGVRAVAALGSPLALVMRPTLAALEAAP